MHKCERTYTIELTLDDLERPLHSSGTSIMQWWGLQGLAIYLVALAVKFTGLGIALKMLQ